MAVINTPSGGQSVRSNPITDAINRRYGQSRPQNTIEQAMSGSGGRTVRGSSSGRGGGSSQADIQAQQEQARLQAQAEEQNRQRQLEAQRQEVIRQQQLEAQRVQAQQQQSLIVASEYQKEIHADTGLGTKDRFKQSGWESTKQAFQGLLRRGTYGETREERLSRARTITDTTGAKIEKPSIWENVISPFQLSGKTVGETPSEVLKKGSISPNESPYYTKEEITKKRESDIMADILKKQQNANEKAMSTPVSESDIKKLQQAQNQYGNLGESIQHKGARESPRIIENVGLAVGGVVASVPTAVYLGATGLIKGSQAQKKYEEGYKVTTAEKVDIGTRLFFGGTLVRTGIGAVERGIIRESVSSLGEAPVSFKQIQKIKGDESLVAYEAQQKYGGLTRNIQGVGKVVKQGENSFILPVGQTRSVTTGKVWNIMGAPKGTQIFQYQASTFGSKGVSKKVGDVIFGVSKTTVEPQVSASVIYGLGNKGITKFSTSARLGGEASQSLGFSATREVSKDIYGNRQFITSGISSDTKLAVQKQRGVTKVITEQPSSGLFSGEVSSSGGGSIFTSTAKPISGIDSAVTPIVKQSEKSIAEVLPKIKPIRFKGQGTKGLFETKTETISAPSVTGISKTSLITEQPQDQKPVQAPPLFGQPQQPKNRGGQDSFLAPIQTQPELPVQRQPPSLGFVLPTRTTQPNINIPTGGFEPMFGLPHLGKVEVGGGQRGKKTEASLFGTTKYNPSLGAVITKQKKKKVTAKEAESLSSMKFSGLESRPILEITDSKPKRKRK